MGTQSYESGKFFIRKNGRLMLTPAMVVLLVIESTDIVFAVDSIPAILAITTDPFLVYTSNAFAILGLRSLYSAIGRLIHTLEFLHHGLAVILAFIGMKMLISHWYSVPAGATLIVVVSVLTSTIVSSIWLRKRRARMREEPADSQPELPDSMRE